MNNQQSATAAGNTLLGATKQRQMAPSNDLMRSFKATTNLAMGLTKERVKIQHDLQKISHGKEQLEELKKTKKLKGPILTQEEKLSKQNKQEIKGTGFNMQMYQSEKGQNMIEAQRDSRRQRHLEALKECEKFVEQFYDSFAERKNEIRERIKIFIAGSDVDITTIMQGLADDKLLANEIQYVNGIWEKVSHHRQARQDELKHLRASFDDLKTYQRKGSGGYLDSMRSNLINIAFFLEPEVDKLIKEWVTKESERYNQEHLSNDQFYEEYVKSEKEKFDKLYQEWKDKVVRFHLLKQQNAIDTFISKLESKTFVNPDSRVQIFNTLRSKQLQVYGERMDLIKQLDNSKSVMLSKEYVNAIDDKLKQINDDAQNAYDDLVQQLNRDMENTNEDLDIALYDLKDFLQKNDAQLEEGQTFESIIAEQAQPTLDRRKLESKTLILNAVKYLDDTDYKMNEICTNIVNFFRELATKIDTNKDKLKQTEINFQVTLASCGDQSDEIIQSQEDDLDVKVEQMRKAIHHVELNEKLQQCFDMLDQITRSYRNYNQDYIRLVEQHPQTMNDFYNDFEKDCMQVFKMQEESKRPEIEALFKKETEEKQKKLEEEALKKYEEEKKAEELKKQEEEKSKPAAAGKGKPAPAQQKKGGKEPEKPNLNVPQLQVPQIQEYISSNGNKYLIERSMDEITTKIMDVSQEQTQQDQPNTQDGDTQQQQQQQQVQSIPTNAGAGSQLSNLPLSQLSDLQIPLQDNQQQPAFRDNDFLIKANMQPPQDPDGVDTLQKDLMITQQEILRILTSARDKCLEWLGSEKAGYQRKVQRESKDLIDKNVDELEENLRKQWPRKGRLEVEVYQERKSQITAHNKKYERQVRTSLEKFNLLEEQWEYVSETVEKEFGNYQNQQDKLRGQLPDGKNLAELQGVSRKEKDSCQTFEEKCREYYDKLHDIAVTQSDILVQQNKEMLEQCVLFEKRGNYSRAEVDWYRGQMKEIDNMILQAKQEREVKLKDLHSRMEKLMREPLEKFEKDYKGSIQNLSAKEGLGKTYGQPRRLAQERLRSEMTKCETAQKGIETLFETLQQLCAKARSEQYSQDSNFDYAKEKQSLSIEIRITLVSLMRCMIHYGTHLSGFAKDPKQLPRLTHIEKQAEVELQQSEQGQVDEKRKDEELEHLGTIGFKTAGQLKFPDMCAQIEKQSKELCVKLYTGENAKYLVGPEKIPEYLSQFLEQMRAQAEGFRIGSVRQLRESALRLVEYAQEIPSAIFGYLNRKYTQIIAKELGSEDKKFRQIKRVDDETKEKHLKLFRPNLENPANKTMTLELNQKENQRTEQFKEIIDETQLKMLDIEQDYSLDFHNAYLNNMRALVKIYDCLLYKEDFIMLPGDEIIEKKHQNIKMLTAQAQKQDISKRSTRKWPGLGPCIFEIDFATLFDHYKDLKPDENLIQQQQPPPQPVNAKGQPDPNLMQQDPNKNEIATEIDVPNTEHHKMIIKARNENYNQFKVRFESSVRNIMGRFDDLRKEELRFNSYWAQNLKEITQKHI